MGGLSPAHLILKAVHLASDADIPAFRLLLATAAETLPLDLVLRILLTYLPEGTEPSLYTDFLGELVLGEELRPSHDVIPLHPSTDDLSETDAQTQVRKLHLLRLAGAIERFNDSDSFTSFLISKAYRIEAETGSLPFLQQLLEPFLDHSEFLRTWAVSTLLPLLRLDYEYYPQNLPTYSLESFEKLEGRLAINALLSPAARQGNENQSAELGRDLRGLVGPWTYGENLRKRSKLDRRRSSISIPLIDNVGDGRGSSDGWSYVNEWILDLSLRDFSQAVRAFEQWDGPLDVDCGGWDDGPKINEAIQSMTAYAQTGLAAIYANHDISDRALAGVHSILEQVSRLVHLQKPLPLRAADAAVPADLVTPEYLQSLSQAHLLFNALLYEPNPLTKPSKSSLEWTNLVLISATTLEHLGHSMTCKSITELGLFGTSTEQMAVFLKILHGLQRAQIREDKSWAKIRQQLLWLRDWSHVFNTDDSSHDAMQGILCKIGKTEFELEILRTLLTCARYKLAIDLYCSPVFQPVSALQVERAVVEVALTAYDNASNGNRSRGGVKKASDILASFNNYFPNAEELKRLSALLSASHALSYYTLTLQHGVPFQPVNIRALPDPISLIRKVLSQNPRSYTKLEDLLDIGKHLERACEPQQKDSRTVEDRQLRAERRIMAMAIDAALQENDFDTAYSYIINRLTQPRSLLPTAVSPRGTPIMTEDDISWRAAYQAGCYLPLDKVNGPSKLRRLEQRMELLSQALLLAPSSAFEEILITWQRCEKDMNVLVAQENEAEEKWDDNGDRKVPGGFFGEDIDIAMQKAREPTRGAMNEEAPMGLFDVARGAAAAIGKSAFPLRSPGSTMPAVAHVKSSHTRSLSITSTGTSDQDSLSGAEGEGRVRKRDVVSNMVTGGLASGIGWVLGAPPVRKE